MTRRLDHIVHAVRDLDSAAAFYERIGFTVGARNVHPWGTCNRLVQFPDFFIEILAVDDVEKLTASSVDGGIGEKFGGFVRDRLGQGEGFAFLMVNSPDATKDAVALAEQGFAQSVALPFSRQGRTPEGEEITLGFSLVFAGDPHAAGSDGFALCHHHNPHVFWNENLQNHRNGARAVRAVVLTADNPTDHHVFLEAYTGVRSLHSTSLGLVAHTERGDVDVVEASFFRDAYGLEAAADESLRLAALRIGVADLPATKAMLAAADLEVDARRGGLVVGPKAAFGATLIFEPLEKHIRG